MVDDCIGQNYVIGILSAHELKDHMHIILFRPLWLLIILLISTFSALAASTEWFETDGAKMRLLVQNQADERGVLRGVVEIKLDQGWKTYWRDPGSNGIPPTFDFSSSSAITDTQIEYPAPILIDDGYATYAGYTENVSFPLKLMTEPSARPHLMGELFIGVCSTVCVPFSALVNLQLNEMITETDHDKLIASASFNLPQPQSPDFKLGTVKLRADGSSLDYELELPSFFPANTTPELFVHGPDDMAISQPKLIETNQNVARFESQIYDMPDLATLEDKSIYVVMKLGPRASETIVPVSDIQLKE